MNKLSFYSLKMLCVFISVAGIAQAAIQTDPHSEGVSEEANRVKIGARAFTHAKKVEIREERARLQEAEPKEQAATADAESGVKPIVAEKRASANKSLVSSSAYASYQLYYTSHPGALHLPKSISNFGGSVELEDGSIWAVRSSDKWKTLNWLHGDTILVAPNRSWFSSYEYRLINQNTGIEVEVNLALGPFFQGPYTHWIQAIDYYNRIIVLEDGSYWSIPSYEDLIIENWQPLDTVIIGVNDGWLIGDKVNILLNVNMLDYAASRCLN